MREISLPETVRATEATSLAACLATILEMPLADVPVAQPGDPAVGTPMMRWLGGLGLALVEVANAASFSFAGPWIGWVGEGDMRRAVVMFGSPSGVVFDPTGAPVVVTMRPVAGHVIAALDIALARPPRVEAPVTSGTVESIWLAEGAGVPAHSVGSARAIAGLGLAGDRHELGTGTFASRQPGSALTLIAAEICESFTPPLSADEHRRNIVTRGIDVHALVGHEFTIGSVRCRGTRICEPCTVIQKYSTRPILRALVHRGGLRADILDDGELRVGDPVVVR